MVSKKIMLLVLILLASAIESAAMKRLSLVEPIDSQVSLTQRVLQNVTVQLADGSKEWVLPRSAMNKCATKELMSDFGTSKVLFLPPSITAQQFELTYPFLIQCDELDKANDNDEKQQLSKQLQEKLFQLNVDDICNLAKVTDMLGAEALLHPLCDTIAGRLKLPQNINKCLKTGGYSFL